jgi:hypothetical protein
VNSHGARVGGQILEKVTQVEALLPPFFRLASPPFF